MLFGTKEIFGIEIEINNFFHDKWIGEGKFIVHICGKPYGRMNNMQQYFILFQMNYTISVKGYAIRIWN